MPIDNATRDQRRKVAMQIRPRGVGEILNTVFLIWGENFSAITKTVGLLMVGPSLILAFAQRPFILRFVKMTEKLEPGELPTAKLMKPILHTLPPFVGAYLLTLPASILAVMTVSTFIHKKYLGQESSVSQSLSQASKRLAATVGFYLALIVFVAIFIIGSGFVVPAFGIVLTTVGYVLALLLAVWFSQFKLLYVVGEMSFVDTIKRCRQLSKGNFWYLLGMGIVFFLISKLFQIAIGTTVSSILRSLGGTNESFMFVWQGLGELVGHIVGIPILAGGLAVVLVNLLFKNSPVGSPNLSQSPPAAPTESDLRLR